MCVPYHVVEVIKEINWKLTETKMFYLLNARYDLGGLYNIIELQILKLMQVKTKSQNWQNQTAGHHEIKMF